MAQFSVQLAPSQLAQTINPWSWTFGPIGQVGLFNINLGSSGAPELPRLILNSPTWPIGPKVQDQGLMVWAS